MRRRFPGSSGVTTTVRFRHRTRRRHHGVGLRERKRAKTAEQIEDAALGLFRDQGYAATTVEDIADAVEISRATVFRYFPAKEDILFARDAADRKHLVERALAHRDRPFAQAVRAALVDFTEHLSADGDRLWLRWDIVRNDPRLMGRCLTAVAGWSDDLARTLAPEPGFAERVVASAAMSGLYEAIGAGRATPEELVGRVEEALDALGIGRRRRGLGASGRVTSLESVADPAHRH